MPARLRGVAHTDQAGPAARRLPWWGQGSGQAPGVAPGPNGCRASSAALLCYGIELADVERGVVDHEGGLQ